LVGPPAFESPAALPALSAVVLLTAWFMACATLMRQRRDRVASGGGAPRPESILMMPTYLAGYAVLVSAVMVIATDAPRASSIFAFIQPGSLFLRAGVYAFVANMLLGVVVAWFSRGVSEERANANFLGYACATLAVSLGSLALVWVSAA
jgi:hypothetical protein